MEKPNKLQKTGKPLVHLKQQVDDKGNYNGGQEFDSTGKLDILLY